VDRCGQLHDRQRAPAADGHLTAAAAPGRRPLTCRHISHQRVCMHQCTAVLGWCRLACHWAQPGSGWLRLSRAIRWHHARCSQASLPASCSVYSVGRDPGGRAGVNRSRWGGMPAACRPTRRRMPEAAQHSLQAPQRSSKLGLAGALTTPRPGAGRTAPATRAWCACGEEHSRTCPSHGPSCSAPSCRWYRTYRGYRA